MSRKLLLVNSAVNDTSVLADSCLPNVSFLLYDYQTDTYESLLQKVADLGISTFDEVGFIFHGSICCPTFKLLDSQTIASIVDNVEPYGNVVTDDPLLDTWSEMRGFINALKSTYAVQTVDIFACSFYGNSNWKYILNTLEEQIGIHIRASSDATGNMTNGGNWIMESDNTNIQDIYFNANIANYQFVFAATNITGATIIYVSNTQITYNSTTILMLSSPWPLTITGNGTLAGLVTVEFTQNIKLTTTTSYFIIGSDYVTIDGKGYTVTYDSLTNSQYTGLVENGTSTANSGKNNVTIRNICVNLSGNAGYATTAGGIGKAYFSNGASNNNINDCYNIGYYIASAGGGIIGGSSTGGVTVTRCYSTGTISASAGGIFGYNCTNVTAINCYSTGDQEVDLYNQSYGGGIFGRNCNYATATNCYSKGKIGRNAGGIFGGICTYVTATNCYSIGSNIESQSGGIFGSTCTSATATNCYSASPNALYNQAGASSGGIFGSYCIAPLTANNCYTLNVTSSWYLAGAGSATVTGSNNSFSTTWSDTTANTNALSGTGGTIWIDIATGSTTVPYLLKNNISQTSAIAAGYVYSGTAPTNLTKQSNTLSSITISFTAGTVSSPFTITNYKYSLNGGTTWTTFSPAQTGSTVIISGPTGGSYQVKLKSISDYGDGTASSALVFNINNPVSGSVTISGNAAVGQTLTASNTLADADGLGTISYQWKSNGTAISGATSSTYQLLQAQVGTTITVTASYTDVAGNNESVTSSATSAVSAPPSAPTGLVPIPGNQQVSIVFTAGATNGSAITTYKYSTDNSLNWFTRTDGGAATSPIIITTLSTGNGTTPLTNGTAYTILILAVNAVGEGTPSSSISETPYTYPSAPTGLVATPGNKQINIAFTDGSNGGNAITTYKYSTDNSLNWYTRTDGGLATSPILITTTNGTTPLTNGTAYTILILAVNAAGDGTPSASVSSTPRTVAAAPTGLVATPGNQQASIAFTAGAENGSAITDYKYSLDGGSIWLNGGTTVSPLVITGLTNGTAYIIRLLAVNAAGDGTYSASINVTPAIVAYPTDWLSLTTTKSSNNISSIYTKGTIDISGGDLVARNGNLFVGQNSTLTGNLLIGNQLGIGTSSFNSAYLLDVNGSVNLRNNAYVTGDLSINGNLFAKFPAGSIPITAINYVSDVTANNRLFVAGDVSTNACLLVSSDTSLNGNAYIAKKAIYVGDVSLNNRLFVSNDVSFNSNLYVAKDLNIIGRLNVKQYTNNSVIDTNTTNYNKLIMSEDISLNGRMFISGDISLNSQLLVSGDMSANNRLFISGDASFNSNLYAANTTIIQGDLSMNGRLFVFGDVSMNGRLYVANGITTTTLYAPSDYRIKQNVQSLSTTPYTVDALNPVFYDNLLTEKPEFGLIADEVKEHFPFAVNGEKDGADYQSVNYIEFISLLVHEIQQLKASINELSSCESFQKVQKQQLLIKELQEQLRELEK